MVNKKGVFRTKEQLGVLLKMVQMNDANVNHKNMYVRRQIWHAIAKRLNRISGATKDAEGWRKSYAGWRFTVGEDHDECFQKLTKDVPDDENFRISVDLSDSEEDSGDELLSTKLQKQRLHSLILKYRSILNSSSDDKPLKDRIWLNIAEELNGMPGCQAMSVRAWKKQVDWSKYLTPRGRKTVGFNMSLKTANEASIYDENLVSESEDDGNVNDGFTSINDVQEDSLLEQKKDAEPEEMSDDFDTLLKEMNDFCQDNASTENGVNGDKDKDCKSKIKRMKPSPIVQSFRLTNRIAMAVEKLSGNVSDMREMLQMTTQSLSSLEDFLQEQNRRQDETNALLKRNGQLLKLLVEFKSGRRTKIVKPRCATK